MSYLILARRVGETLIIGDDISVTVLGVADKLVRIGVQASDHFVHLEIALEHDAECGDLQLNAVTATTSVEAN